MEKLNELYVKYGEMDCRNLSYYDKKDIKDGLQTVEATEICSDRDALKFINVLANLRRSLRLDDELHGINYAEFLRQILSVGEAGLYADEIRFIYELIQNVDDCNYDNSENCSLKIYFDYSNGQIILTYNETGFTPNNVLAITGTAEAAKNLTADKIEIGEKGIGFKSVFGVADKVLIQSGWFSFELSKEEYTIPVPIYDDYKKIDGTKMTLFTSCEKVKYLYRELSKAYGKKDIIIKKNPILFLNKLTTLKIYESAEKYLELKVSKRISNKIEQFTFEDDLQLSFTSVDNRDHQETTIDCYRFSYPAKYDYDAWISRYGTQRGNDTTKTKKMIVSAVVPKNIDDITDGGTLYSFLPMKVRLSVPIAVHAPFKLNAAREYVDSQNNNKWFIDTYTALCELIKGMFCKLADIQKENIVWYLPEKRGSIFAFNSENAYNLTKRDGLNIFGLPIFYTVDGVKEKASDIISLDESEGKVYTAYELIHTDKKLFVPPKGFAIKRLRNWDIEVRERDEIARTVFQESLNNPTITKKALEYLSPFAFINLDETYLKIKLAISQIELIMTHKMLYEKFNSYVRDIIGKELKLPEYKVSGIYPMSLDYCLKEDGFDINDVPYQVKYYLESIDKKCAFVDVKKPLFFATGNCLILSRKNSFESFIDFCELIDHKSPYIATNRLKIQSNKLNHMSDDAGIPAQEFLRDLKVIRSSISSLLGEEIYEKYVKIINEAGSDKFRFVNELLQNADDCEYILEEDQVPAFELKYTDKNLTTECNEVGFKKSNVRAITAIGESTKKSLLINGTVPIGEKGVGFKSVFSVAKNALIHSGDFCFTLNAAKPTIPEPKYDVEPVKGTKMVFELKERLPDDLFKKEGKVLKLCLCLRQLKKITLGNFVVTIEDTEDERKITINDKIYLFKRTVHNFTINDEGILKSRATHGRMPNKDQRIVCYTVDKPLGKTKGLLYNGLPTKNELNIPLFIDAPFELTTSREDVQQNKWNNIILTQLYRTIELVILERRSNLKLDSLMDYLGIELERASNGSYTTKYSTRIFNENDVWMNSVDWINKYVRTIQFLPTYEDGVFVSPANKHKRYPYCAIAVGIFRKIKN